MYQGLQPALEEDLYASDAAAFAAAAATGLNCADESLPYSTSELNAPEYSTDDFRMYQFKVARCSKRYVHDWRACPFAHPTENARRRDPRHVKYLPVPCPDYKRGICLRGDSCTYSHGVYECWLHPAKYRTQLCKEGPNCRRPVCFFAHSVLDLRQPSHFAANGSGGHAPPQQQSAPAGDSMRQANMAAALLHQQQQAAAAAAAASRLSTDSAFSRLSSEEMMNNIQDSRSPAEVAALVAAPAHNGNGAASLLSRSPASRQSVNSSLSRASSSGTRPTGSAPHSPERSGSPPNAVPARTSEPTATAASEAAAALAVLTQQQASAAQAAAAVATTQAMLKAGADGSLPPRMSLDSLLAARQQAAGWTGNGPAPAPPTAAEALATAGAAALPLNEQPFPSGNAPRMSNAVARKLGLAPQRASLDTRLTKMRGVATPPRSSIDGILHALQQTNARSSVDQHQQQQQAAMLQHAMHNPQLQGMGGINGAVAMQPQINGFGGPSGYVPAGHFAPQPGHGHPAGPDGSMALHPALLSLVAAQMVPPMHASGMPAMAPPSGVPNGMHSGLGGQHGGDANMAALMDSLHGWQLNGGNGGGPHHSMAQRAASMDGLGGMAAAQVMHSAQSGAYYEPKGIWGSQEAINNQAGAES
ncbi:hypothetical protein D9Q98_005077 [Chlorella vulgaris]|uniref:C3H1-type domain-containing protein n=1 Tax=Chlorella vulgaris TaxID=3077 RepID=A0A9D4YWT5_CHLVU|nr:hypothetical protein D9Q98_005077 [Chlorella vulgaris]